MESEKLKSGSEAEGHEYRPGIHARLVIGGGHGGIAQRSAGEQSDSGHGIPALVGHPTILEIRQHLDGEEEARHPHQPMGTGEPCGHVGLFEQTFKLALRSAAVQGWSDAQIRAATVRSCEEIEELSTYGPAGLKPNTVHFVLWGRLQR